MEKAPSSQLYEKHIRKYVGGSAKRAIEGHFLVGTDTYYAYLEILYDRFGNPFIIGKSYRDKIQSWTKINTKDTKDLREFADFLSRVESPIPYVQGLQVLHDCVEHRRTVAKLPDWLSARWNRIVTEFQDEHKMFPDLSYFVKFLNKEARIACNPFTSLFAIKPTEPEKNVFKDKPKRNYMQNAKTCTSSVIPVYVSTMYEPENEKLVYALLDTQSDTTFILKATAQSLNAMSELVKLKICTITSKTKIDSSSKLKDLQVRGLYSETRI